jgi:ribulose-phosphate 3-epimerase
MGKGSSANGKYFETTVSKIFSDVHPEHLLALAPSILAADFTNLGAEIRRVGRKRVRWIHVDVMDGHFVPNLSVGPPVVKSLRTLSSQIFLDTHLMLDNPMEYVEAFVRSGADLVNIHAEAVSDLPRALNRIRRLGVRVGVTIKPKTPVSAIEAVLDKVDLVLVMTVEPGFGGQELIPAALSKVRQLARLREERGLKFLIQADGGIDPKTVGLAVAAGANVLVAGSAVFGKGEVSANIDALVEAALQI